MRGLAVIGVATYYQPMRRSRRLLTPLCIVVAWVAAATAAWSQPVPFQATFGTDLPITPRGGVADEGYLLAEATNGDIFVAGVGAGIYSDIGSEAHPMLARFDRLGRMIWKRFYTELPFGLLGLFSDRNGDFILVARRNSASGSLHADIQLRRIGPDGDLSDVVQQVRATFPYDGVFDYADRGVRGQMFYGTTDPGVTREEPGPFPRPVIVMLTDGTVEIKPPPVGFVVVQQMAGGELLLYREKPGIPYRRTTDTGIEGFGSTRTGDAIAIGDFAGNVDEILDRDTDELFFRTNVFGTTDAIFLLRELYVEGNKHGFVSTYTHAGVLIAESGAAGGERLTVPAAPPGGGMVAVGRDPATGQALLFEYSAQGQLLWSAGFDTAGRGNFVRDAKVLRDGWLAVAGATWQDEWDPRRGGRWLGDDTPRDTDAFLLVTARSPAGLASASYQGPNEPAR